MHRTFFDERFVFRAAVNADGSLDWSGCANGTTSVFLFVCVCVCVFATYRDRSTTTDHSQTLAV
jgi:hypothetical protein